jgi:hypothetical protein
MWVKWSWAALALIHAVPALALFKPSLLTRLYGASAGSNTYLLLHHRAALFAGVFIACLWALTKTESRQLAVVIVGLSMLSFLILYFVNGMPKSLQSIAIIDLVGLPFLMVVGWNAFYGLGK